MSRSFEDDRPSVWVGHIELHTERLDESEAFMRAIGMRPIASGEGYAVLELRGGTHLVLAQRQGVIAGPAPFDLMVDDLEAAHRQYNAAGLQPSAIESGSIHSWFTLREPGGHVITVNSTHVSDLPV